jgi:hypothetical protein
VCSHATLHGKQKQCPACANLQKQYRARKVDPTTYFFNPDLTLNVKTYTEYLASKVMSASRAIVGQHVRAAESDGDAALAKTEFDAKAAAEATARHSIDLREVPASVRVRSFLASMPEPLPLPNRLPSTRRTSGPPPRCVRHGMHAADRRAVQTVIEGLAEVKEGRLREDSILFEFMLAQIAGLTLTNNRGNRWSN